MASLTEKQKQMLLDVDGDRLLGASVNTCRSTLRGLMKRGLVAWVASESARGYFLTPSGREASDALRGGR